eukprot:175907_1
MNALKFIDQLITLIDTFDDDEKETIQKASGYTKQTSLKLTTRYGDKINTSYIPQVGLGTWRSDRGKVLSAVEYALSVGYKHIDCAYGYRNEDEVGKGISNAIQKGYITRDKLFVTSKLWNTKHHPDDVIPALKDTLNDLGLQYIDLYLIHWPIGFKRGGEFFPKNEDGTIQYGEVIPLEDTWSAMEKAVELGLTKHIGISNFNSKQIDFIIKNGKIAPTVLQCEAHPFFNQKRLINFCKGRNIVFTGYSPLGSPGRPSNWDFTVPVLMENKTVVELANKYNVSAAQICIRYQVDNGNVVIPKSVTPKRILSNMEIWDFKLTKDEVEKLNSLDVVVRYCSPKVTTSDGSRVWRDKSHPYFPFLEDF